MIRELVLLLLAILLARQISAFYVPGVAPIEFKKGDEVEVKAIKLQSTQTLIPYEFYSLPFCKPAGAVTYKSESIGELLRGDRISNTAYTVAMLEDVKCSALCSSDKLKTKLSAEQSNLLRQRIVESYNVQLLVDNLPCSTRYEVRDTGEAFYEPGYRLGWADNENKVYLNNHIDIILSYHEPTAGAQVYRVVEFEVKPSSIESNGYKFGDKSKTCTIGGDAKAQELLPDTENTITWTYSVTWRPSSIPWSSRWDLLLKMRDAQIHWLSILNSLIVLFCLSAFVWVIILRTVRRDIAKYNRTEDLDDVLEDHGWKQVHGDVFRPPRYVMLLVNFVGTGIQLLGMTTVTVAFAMLGMLSPSSRGALTSVAIFLFCLMGVIAGYHSGRLYKTLRGDQPKRCALRTAVLFPLIVLGTGFILNFFLIGKHSSGAVPFTTMIALALLWLGIDLPLLFIGFHFGFRKQPYSHPVRFNHIPRQLPAQPWYLKTFPCSVLAGLLPFSAVFIELYFIFSALWQGHFYYLFGFLALALAILFVACGQIAIVVIYFLLSAEQYRWWWKSFSISCGASLYVMAYSVYYYYAKLSLVGFIPTLLYFSYSTLIALTFAIITGTVGFYAAYFFLCKLYGSIKID